MRELEDLDMLLKDIRYLKDRSELLDLILSYWNKETMTFNIPDKWKSMIVTKDKWKDIPASPRHRIAKKMYTCLPFDEYINLIDVDVAHETYSK